MSGVFFTALTVALMAGGAGKPVWLIEFKLVTFDTAVGRDIGRAVFAAG